jgi:predicted GNAT superfamily acetyltransferase
LTKVAGNLEDAADIVWQIKKDAECIESGLKSINTTGGVVAGALPLLYGMAEGIVAGATFQHDEHVAEGVNRPAMGTRRSRQIHGVGVAID